MDHSGDAFHLAFRDPPPDPPRAGWAYGGAETIQNQGAVVHPGLPDRGGNRVLPSGVGRTGQRAEGAFQVPDDPDAVSDRREPEPGKAPGAGSEAGDHGRRIVAAALHFVVRADLLPHRQLRAIRRFFRAGPYRRTASRAVVRQCSTVATNTIAAAIRKGMAEPAHSASQPPNSGPMKLAVPETASLTAI
ncbi:hypothetical protein SDC9_191020 [bioreactor metagenome]|uniref:Uncharacterized protein n=1 Tax=bioreactor metagenome TaxID=1076179 RepID=A0A645HX72_9ZZZZ